MSETSGNAFIAVGIGLWTARCGAETDAPSHLVRRNARKFARSIVGLRAATAVKIRQQLPTRSPSQQTCQRDF
jgi:hypothetical protein